MHLVHRLGWNFAVTLLVGMVVAMAVQTLLALFVTPILGSIESMVPSMVVAMTTLMAVCTLDGIGCGLSGAGCFQLGAALGAGMFLFIQVYGFLCRRSLRRAFPEKGSSR